MLDFLIDFVWECKVLVFPLVTLMLITVFLALLGYTGIAFAVGLLGLIVIVYVNIIYIALTNARGN